MKKLRMHDHEIHPTPAGKRIMDRVRNQFVPAGPEELVRQSVIHTLHKEYGYPLASLRSEELIERGSKELRRADVLVMLPRAKNVAEVTIESPAPAQISKSEPLYSENFAAAQADLGKIPGIKLISVPDQLTLTIDGEEIVCQTLGFDADYGYELSFAISKETSIRLQIPEVIRYRLLGYGMTEAEIKMASSFNLPQLAWTEPSNKKLYQSWEALIQEIEFQDYYSLDSFSEDGTSGWLRHLSSEYAWGVLVFFDSKAHGLKEYLKKLKTQMQDEEGYEEEIKENPLEESRETVSEEESSMLSTEATLIVVECKAPKVNYTETVLKQGLYYAKKRGALFLVLTNGESWTQTYFLGNGKEPKEIEELPSYQEAITGKYKLIAVAPDDPHFPLPGNPLSKPDAVRLHARIRNAIGCDTAESLWPILLSLEDLFLGDKPLFSEPFSAFGIEFSKDEGAHFLEAGNPSGGTFSGKYRLFLLKLSSGEHILFGCALFGTWKAVGSKLWGNRKSITTLIGALSFDAEMRQGIECCMDRSMEQDESANYLIRHDGRITVGKGAVSTSKLTEYILQKNPALIDGKKFSLGKIPSRFPLSFDDVHDFLTRFVSYTLLRDEFKRQVRAERKKT